MVTLALNTSTDRTSQSTRGSKFYELSNHLGYVTSLGQTTAQGYKAQVQSASDYFPFGWAMSGRQYSADSYRFGFNGMEKNPETEGSYTTEYRQLDTRIGRWLLEDPITHHSMSPYNSMDNNPISTIDPDGRNGIGTVDKKKKRVTIEANLVFYRNRKSGVDFDRLLVAARKATRSIRRNWRGRGGRIEIDGVKYKPRFKITYEVVSESEARERFNAPDDELNYKDNFIGITDTEGQGSFSSNFGNLGIWSIQSLEAKHSYTAAHEFGHLMGWRDESIQKDANSLYGHHDTKGALSRNGRFSIPGVMLPNKASWAVAASMPNKWNKPNFGKRFVRKDGMLNKIRKNTARDVEMLLQSRLFGDVYKVGENNYEFGFFENLEEFDNYDR